MINTLKPWLIFIKERFSPVAYLPLLTLFVVANGLYVVINENLETSYLRWGLALIVITSAFFRLRLFDEIKDYETDLKINPTRPLARGLLSITQVRLAIAILIFLELAIAVLLGPWAFLVHALAIAYSLLMFEEFFIGPWLRPHLTTYAVTHTVISAMLGLSAAILVSNHNPFLLTYDALFFFLSHWAFFNLFEFARKTYAPEEERPHVPSYSQIFSPSGAWFLSLSEAFIGILLITATLKNPFVIGRDLLPIYILFVVFFIISLSYLIKTNRRTANVFRALAGIYLLSHYAAIVYIYLKASGGLL